MTKYYVGIDGDKDGWVVASLLNSKTVPQIDIYPSDIKALWQKVSPNAKFPVLIDIPIGLGNRADLERSLRKELGPAKSSVFSTKDRKALRAARRSPTFTAANHDLPKGSRFTKQEFAIIDKILEVDDYLISCLKSNANITSELVESHPELAFVRLADLSGVARPSTKKTKQAGKAQRWDIIAGFSSGAISRAKVTASLNLKFISKNGIKSQYEDDILDAIALALLNFQGQSHGFSNIPLLDANLIPMQFASV